MSFSSDLHKLTYYSNSVRCLYVNALRSLFCFVGGHSTFFGMLNTFVHIVMYSYYLLAALGPKVQKYLWWKKYLTALQMVSFFIKWKCWTNQTSTKWLTKFQFPGRVTLLRSNQIQCVKIFFINLNLNSYLRCANTLVPCS